MSNKQSSVDWLWSFVEPSLTDAQKYFFSMIIEEARVMHKKEIITAHSTALPIEDGVFTAIDKAQSYYNETFGGNNEQ